MTGHRGGSAGWPEPPGWPPEVPAPGEPPRRPPTPPPVPIVYDTEPPTDRDLRERLLERRVVLASGFLDDATATEVAARLMYLDGTGDDPIELRYSCPNGDLGAAITLADTIELLGVELRATAAGTVGGAAVLPYAVATRRLAQPHASFTLAEPELHVRGRATDVLSDAERHARLVDALYRRLAEATGRSPQSVAADVGARRQLTAEEARAYGLVDEIAATRRPRPIT